MERLIPRLGSRDFELLVELIFSNSRWRRTSAIGGTTKLLDFELEDPVTGDRAFVQVKARTSQKEFQKYVDGLNRDESGYSKMFYVYHSAKPAIRDTKRENVQVWACQMVADQAVKNGLVEWVIHHAR